MPVGAVLLRIIASAGGMILRMVAWIMLFPIITSLMRNLANPNSALRSRFRPKDVPPKPRSRKGDPVKANYEILDQQELK